jgi:hypothetical protein
MLKFSVMHVMLGFDSPYLKRKWCPLASRCTSHLIHTFFIAHVDSMVKLMSLNSEFLLFRSFWMWGILIYIYSLTCPTSEDDTGLDLANVESTIPCLVFYHQWYSLYQSIQLFSVWGVALSCGKKVRFSHNQTSDQKWCHNLCNT